MEVPSEVLKIADDIKSMKIRGAGNIARAAAEALKTAAELYRGPADRRVFTEYIEKISSLILSTRPTAVSLPNAVLYVTSALENVGGGFEEARSTVIEVASKFIKETLEAYVKISEFGAKRLKDNSVVLTHCHSTAVVNVIVKAFKLNKVSKVYSTETRPVFQGRITVRELSKHGVPVVQIPDSAVRYVMHEVDHALVGADAVACNGALINKIGTSQIALSAKEARVNFYVVAETYKFSPETIIGELIPIEHRPPEELYPLEVLNEFKKTKFLNPVFDVTPPEYIDALITEIGVIPPQLASYVLFEKYGWALNKIKIRRMGKILVEDVD